ncbi:MAG: outer membrane protein assembly factor BamE [Pseudomonadota bacterium]|nr:outer membrane protein assembly factor BamE [Pseudomonadota bacterium]
MSNQVLQRVVWVGLASFFTACTYLTPYKLPIQQGNIIESESLPKLKSGMSKNQAAQVLGTPLLNDIFHANRWDYVHYLNKRGRMSEQKHVALIFEEEKLVRLVGEGVPALAPMAAPDASATAAPAAAPTVDDAAVPKPEPSPGPDKE